MPSKVVFADKSLEDAILKLRDGKTEDMELHATISNAIRQIEENAFCGVQIPKKLIPKEYLKRFGVDNLWKFDLEKGWRLLYSIKRQETLVTSILLEWMNHKHYERRLKY